MLRVFGTSGRQGSAAVPAAAQAEAALLEGEAAGRRVVMEVRVGLQAAAWAPCRGYWVANVGVMAVQGVGGRSVATGVVRVARAGEWEGSNPGSIRRTRSLDGRGNLSVERRSFDHFSLTSRPHRRLSLGSEQLDRWCLMHCAARSLESPLKRPGQ